MLRSLDVLMFYASMFRTTERFSVTDPDRPRAHLLSCIV